MKKNKRIKKNKHRNNQLILITSRGTFFLSMLYLFTVIFVFSFNVNLSSKLKNIDKKTENMITKIDLLTFNLNHLTSRDRILQVATEHGFMMRDKNVNILMTK